MQHSILILGSEEIKEIYSIKEAIRVVEKAFMDHAKGIMRMPSKVYLDLPEHNGDFRAMPAYSAIGKVASIKWVNSHPNNRKKHIPAVMGSLILNDARTALPLSFMDATILTSLRTGAAGGVAAKHLSRADAKTLAMVGCGMQAVYQAMAVLNVRKIKSIRIYDTSREAKESFAQKIQELFKGEVISCNSAEECVRDAHIVCTTTPAHEPVVFKDWISPGTHINAIGADAAGKRELDDSLLKTSRIFVDEMEQASHSGEVNVPLKKNVIKPSQISGNIGDVLTGKIPGRTTEKEITIFDSTGLAIQDLASAHFIFKKAEKSGKGTPIPFLNF